MVNIHQEFIKHIACIISLISLNNPNNLDTTIIPLL